MPHASAFGQAGVDKPPATWDEFFAAADKLKAKNIPALAIAEDGPGFTGHVFENILLASLGPDGYRGLFNGKIAPLIPYAIRGALWYQGEANSTPAKAAFYQHQLPLLIRDWRARWGYDFPIAWAQLPNFTDSV